MQADLSPKEVSLSGMGAPDWYDAPQKISPKACYADQVHTNGHRSIHCRELRGHSEVCSVGIIIAECRAGLHDQFCLLRDVD